VDSAGNYDSGDDYVVEFLGYRFSFNAYDFEQRVTAAAVKLGLLAGNELDDDETADLVELVRLDEPELDRGPDHALLEVEGVEAEAVAEKLDDVVVAGAVVRIGHRSALRITTVWTMVASAPHWQRLVVLAPVFLIGGGLVLGVLILLGRAFADSVRESGHKRVIVAGLVVLAGAVVVLTYLGVELPRE